MSAAWIRPKSSVAEPFNTTTGKLSYQLPAGPGPRTRIPIAVPHATTKPPLIRQRFIGRQRKT